MSGKPEAFLPLPSASFHVLLALLDEPKHGYAVMQEVDRLSYGAVKMGPGTVYTTVKRLLDDGLIEEIEPADGSDARRRSYRVTGLGESVCRAEVRRLSRLIHRSVLSRLAPSLKEAF